MVDVVTGAHETRKRKAVKPGHQCKLMEGTPIDYSLTSAGNSNLNTPCTNRPLECQHCSQVVASYSMAEHYEEKHSATAMPEVLRDAVALGKHERAHTMKLLTKRKLEQKVMSAKANLAALRGPRLDS